VSAPFHCQLMQPAAEGLERTLQDIAVQPFEIGVVTNAEADVNRSAERVKALLIEQAIRPVRWEESVKKLVALNCHRAIEIGPGKILKGLMKRIEPTLQVENFEAPQDLSKIISARSQ